MSVIGIICEYNPLHNGHLDHIRQCKEKLGADSPVVCVMSGDFVQRGTPAVFDKHIRARAACESGVDLVLELPLPWCLASAERFARGGVALLNSLGIVSHLAFGSESGDLAALTALALSSTEPETLDDIKREMDSGLGFAPARQKVLTEKLGKSLGELLEKPNNILGVEYMKALFALNSDMIPFTSLRRGSVHDGKSTGAYRSASELRAMMEAGENAGAYIPAAANRVFRGCNPSQMEDLEQAYMARLRLMSETDFNALPDATEGLGNRLYKAVRTEPGVEAVLSAVKTKRYPTSRLRRMLSCGVLGVTADMADGLPSYARVLAANETGRRLLRQMDGKSTVPIVTKPASAKKLAPEAAAVFALGAAARDFYVLGYESIAERTAGTDWKTDPVMI